MNNNVKAGDRIRIINAKLHGGEYGNGDEFIVNEVWISGVGVTTTEGLPIYAEEFEVIGAEVNAEDNVNHPSHYTQGGVEVIDIIAQITRGYTDGFHAYCVGNALKYLARAPHKHATIDEDIKKAAKYIEFITEDQR